MFRRKIKRALKSRIALISLTLKMLVLAMIVYGFFYGMAELVNYFVRCRKINTNVSRETYTKKARYNNEKRKCRCNL